ncbi:MAG: hypothetical protein U0411_13065 [Thermodesulfovibrionales bacterium]
MLCITHLPQIAALADHHLLVEKIVEQDRTVVVVRRLSSGPRQEELAHAQRGITDVAAACPGSSWGALNTG